MKPMTLIVPVFDGPDMLDENGNNYYRLVSFNGRGQWVHASGKMSKAAAQKRLRQCRRRQTKKGTR